VKHGPAVGLLLGFALAVPAAAQNPSAARDNVVEIKHVPPQASSLDTLWDDYKRLDAAGDREGAARVAADLVRVRVERNIASLEPMALALVADGLERLKRGERDAAEELFNRALGLDPHLADAYIGLAQAQLRRGPLGILPAVRHAGAAFTAQAGTARGGYHLRRLVVPAALLALLAVAAAVSVGLLINYGPLLLHDLEEEFGPTRGAMFARGLFALLVLLPVVLLQGWAWLPLWWLALVFVYLGVVDRVVAALLVLGAIAVPAVVGSFQTRMESEANPVFGAALTAVEGGPDARATAQLEAARGAAAADRDLTYLLARQYRKQGRVEEAAALYRGALQADAKDVVALNNLANIDFARGDFNAAIARYKQAAEAAGNARFAGTVYYNLSQAHLQKFEFQPAQEARAQADRLAGGLTREYETRWRYEKGGAVVATVVDLGPTAEEVLGKFRGVPSGSGRPNVTGRPAAGFDAAGLAGGLLTRFLGFGAVFVLGILAVSRWRGAKLFTLRCPRCGTPFCRRCQLGQTAGGLCTQCYHLFVVKDGVSANARNQKLHEVQKEENRRLRVFQILSLVSPGTGHVYARMTLLGLVLLILWYGLLALTLLAGRPLTVTDVPAGAVSRWAVAPAVLALLLVWLVANRWRPSFDVEMPVARRVPASRPRAAAS
jgi:tetratricopeptide (TPR) repeat protein